VCAAVIDFCSVATRCDQVPPDPNCKATKDVALQDYWSVRASYEVELGTASGPVLGVRRGSSAGRRARKVAALSVAARHRASTRHLEDPRRHRGAHRLLIPAITEVDDMASMAVDGFVECTRVNPRFPQEQ
jgi:hypothetical protein